MNALSASGTLNAAIKDIDAGFTTSWSNNNTNNELDIDLLGVLGAAIKNTDAKSITNETNNNMDSEIDANMFIGKTISKTDTELTMGKLYKANTIVRKEI